MSKRNLAARGPALVCVGDGRPTRGESARGNWDLSRLDSDGDGKLSKDEAPQQMHRFFEHLDSNSDGFIDKQEIDRMKRRIGSVGSGQPAGRRE